MATNDEPKKYVTEKASDAHLSKIENYFDERAEYWSDLYDKPKSGNDIVLASRTKLAVDMIADNVPSGTRILDAGCGAGVASLALLERGYSVHGLDIAQDLLNHARDRLSGSGIADDRWRLIHGDFATANFETEYFDGIVALGFIQYQQDEIDALSECLRILKPGGWLVVTGPSRHRISNLIRSLKNVKKLMRPSDSKPKDKDADKSELDKVLEISVHDYTPSRFRRLLASSGFEFVRFVGHGGLGRKLTAVSRVLPIERWANDLIVLAKKPG